MREYRFYKVVDLASGPAVKFAHRVASAVRDALFRLQDNPGRVSANDDVITNTLDFENENEESPRFIEALGEQPVKFEEFEAAFSDVCRELALEFSIAGEAVWDWKKREWVTSRLWNK